MDARKALVQRWKADGVYAVPELSGVALSQLRRLLSHVLSRHKYGRLGRGSCVLRPAHLTNPRFMFIGEDVIIRDGARLEAIRHYGSQTFTPRLSIGDRTFAEYGLHIACANAVAIGADVLFAGNVFISDLHHGFGAPGRHPLRQPISVKKVRIGDACWIGERACILPGVELGEGCVVGAGAVVTKSFPAYSVIAGVPARKIGENPGSAQ